MSEDAVEAAARFWEALGFFGSGKTIRDHRGYRLTVSVFADFEDLIRAKVEEESNQPNTLIEPGPDGPTELVCHHQFTIDRAQDGRYIASRNTSPCFAVVGDSIIEAAEKAEQILRCYNGIKGEFE